jgi:hypothetical protein
MKTTVAGTSLSRFLIFVGVVLGLANVQDIWPLARSWSAESRCLPCVPTGRELTRLGLDELDELFARGQVITQPVGLALGRVVYKADSRLPHLRARLASVVWKGKDFCADGSFINQWLCFQAISSHVTIGPSWYDGQPCVILEYPPGTAVFGNARDEIREIAPGVLLGRFYERCPCPKLQGYFVLEIQKPRKCDGNSGYRSPLP